MADSINKVLQMYYLDVQFVGILTAVSSVQPKGANYVRVDRGNFPAQRIALDCVQFKVALNTNQEGEAVSIYCPNYPPFFVPPWPLPFRVNKNFGPCTR